MNGKLAVLPGTSNPKLFKAIVADIRKREEWHDFRAVKGIISAFSDSEPRIEINENIRGSNVFILQSTCSPVGHNIVELCLMIDACKRASAQSITAVVPYFGLARQDRKKKSREPISASWVAKILLSSGAQRIISFDLHAGQIQGFFDGPFDNMYARPIFLEYIKRHFSKKKIVIVSPDVGAADRARGLARRLNNAPIAIIDKRRSKANASEVMHVIGTENVIGRTAFIFDDMSDTSGTLCKAAKVLKEIGVEAVYGLCTHAVLSGPAMGSINSTNELEELIVTDTIPLTKEGKACKKIKVISVKKLIAKAILRSHEGRSISDLFR